MEYQDFAEWFSENRKQVESLTKYLQQIAHSCDVVARLNLKWIVQRLNEDDLEAVLRAAIIRLRNIENPDYMQITTLRLLRQELFIHLMRAIEEYCMD